MRRELRNRRPSNQSLQLRFLRSGLNLKQADLPANAPDEQGADGACLVSWVLSPSSPKLVFGETEARKQN